MREECEFEDLRDFVDVLRKLGQLRTIEGADWDLEIGALTEAVAEQKGHALLFDRVKGYPAGFRILTNPFGSLPRTALLLRLPVDVNAVTMLDLWRRRLANFTPIAAVEVRDGATFEMRIVDQDVNLWKFPAPRWHELDGGRYIGTGAGVITRDPETGVVNIGAYRCMIQSNNTMSVKPNKGKHGQIHMEKYHAEGKSCPVVVSLGQDPTLLLAAGLAPPFTVSEYDFAGWVRGRPVPVVQGEFTGLPIPADAEIVAEGEIPPPGDVEWPREGPFGEWLGYFTPGTIGEVPLMHVKAIYYRRDPILLGLPPLKPPAPFPYALPVGCGIVWDQLEKAGIPGVKGVWSFVGGGGAGGPFLVVAIKQLYSGHGKQTAMVAASCRGGALGGKFVVVVDDDVDITNPGEVIWAIATRCDVGRGTDIVKGVWTTRSDPSLSPAQRVSRNYSSDRIIIDGCRPYEWKEEFPPVNAFSPEYKRDVLERWRAYLA
ncbi:MAG: UbiD family decarboxylase [Deltaproteobacteria bacterium]|nr:UbiD family decarboxylase [Deltaproteobacteria bacterium]